MNSWNLGSGVGFFFGMSGVDSWVSMVRKDEKTEREADFLKLRTDVKRYFDPSSNFLFRPGGRQANTFCLFGVVTGDVS